MKSEKKEPKKITILVTDEKFTVGFDGFGYDTCDLEDLVECVETLIVDVMSIVR